MNVTRQIDVKLALLRTARAVKQVTGKGVAAQLLEITRLRFGPGRLHASDYYAFEVYDDSRYPSHAKREVVSWDGKSLGRRLNADHWRMVCRDKLISYGLFRSMDVPFPELYAIYSAGRRPFGNVPSLSTPSSMAAFLRDDMRYPFFGKYVDGSFGRGASSVQSYDPQTDRLRLAGGEQVDVEAYVRDYVVPRPAGYLFQELIRQHPAIDRITGGRIATLRVVVLVDDDGPRVYRLLWRLPVGVNITDNFDHGAQGNILAFVSRESGIVERAVRGMWVENGYGSERLGRPVEDHPDTGARVAGIELPHWRDSVALCLNAAAGFPGFRYQAWDVVVTDRGPTVLEVNSRGSVLQVPGCRGYYDSELAAFVQKHGNGTP